MTATRQREHAGLVWALLGLAFCAPTLLGVAWVQVTDPLPIEGVLLLLGLGGIPAMTCLLAALWRRRRARARGAAAGAREVGDLGRRLAIGGLVTLFAGAGGLAGATWMQRLVRLRHVAEAQQAVEAVLRDGQAIPRDFRDRVGVFERATGEGFRGAVWNIQGYDHVVADRNAQFTNATVPLRIVVSRGERLSVGRLHVDAHSLYLRDAPRPQRPVAGLVVRVSHPDF